VHFEGVKSAFYLWVNGFWRAPTDNDRGNGQPSRNGAWRYGAWRYAATDRHVTGVTVKPVATPTGDCTCSNNTSAYTTTATTTTARTTPWPCDQLTPGKGTGIQMSERQCGADGGARRAPRRFRDLGRM
jgi:hypothetical protein